VAIFLKPTNKTGRSGQQFRLIFTPDPASPSTHKLAASNPGQFFYYNVFYIKPPSSTGTTLTLTITTPYPFVNQGSVPIHVARAESFFVR